MTLDTWLQAMPGLAGKPEQDSQALASYVQAGELFLRSLCPKAGRAERDRQAAAAIHGQCRELRRRFMALHAAWLYRALTDDRRSRKTLAELAYAAAASFFRPNESSITATRTIASPRPGQFSFCWISSWYACTACSRWPMSASSRARSVCYWRRYL